MRGVAPFVAALLALPVAANGQGYRVDWHTVDGGGAMETSAANYTLSGTTGQPDAEPPRSNGGFTLHGGFWVAQLANNPPRVKDDAYSTPEDTPLVADDADGSDTTNRNDDGVLANDVNVDNDPLTLARVQGDAGNVDNPTATAEGNLVTVHADGTFTFHPVPDFHGPPLDSFTYQVCDAKDRCDTATVTIDVSPANDPPVAKPLSYTTSEDTLTHGNVLTNDTDADGDTLSVSLISGPFHGVLILNPTGAFTYTPAANFNGTDHFRYEVSDSHGGTNQTSVTLNVISVNDPPVARHDSATIRQGSAASGNVLSNDTDVEGDPLSASLVTGPAHAAGFVLHSDGSFRYTPAAGFAGTDSFTYQTTDGAGGSDRATAKITVSALIPTLSGWTLGLLGGLLALLGLWRLRRSHGRLEHWFSTMNSRASS